MDKEKKIREPFKPEDTPRPPQIIDPEVKSARKNPGEEQKEKSGTADKDKANGDKKEKASNTGLLSDQAEINDETTI